LSKLKVIDLFAGCGGLGEGFKQAGFSVIASVDWEKACVNTLNANFKGKHKTFHADIREYSKYLTGNDSLKAIAKEQGVDGIIGGPPCQAYSLAGRIRCPSGMRDDYRNYLFESYIEVLKTLKPKFFVFENVTGMLSAKPGGLSVTDRMKESFEKAGYVIPDITKEIVFDLADYGGPQKRKRVILFGVKKGRSQKQAMSLIQDFYDQMSLNKKSGISVEQAIGDLPALVPSRNKNTKESHKRSGNDSLHIPRYHNKRDMEIFRLLAKDALSEKPKYKSSEALKELYTKKTKRISAVHKYHVLEKDGQSNLIPAHLYKDGLRHIHYDPAQARSITMREAARLQTFPDKYQFIGSQGDIYKMIGNAVPPLLAKVIARNIKKCIKA